MQTGSGAVQLHVVKRVIVEEINFSVFHRGCMLRIFGDLPDRRAEALVIADNHSIRTTAELLNLLDVPEALARSSRYSG